MTTPTLEAIPEETTSPAVAPTAAPSVDCVTSDVLKTKPATAKNPGKFASGKRLAERNRLAREAKTQAEAQKQNANIANNTNTSATEQSSDNTTNTGYLILGIGVLIVSGLGVYYQREAIMRTLGKAQKPVESKPTTLDVDPPPSSKPKVKCRIIKMK